MTQNLIRIALLTTIAGGCAAGDFSGEITSGAGYVDNGEVPTFLEFEEATFRETGADGVYIVNGDTAISNKKQLREYYDSLYSSSLIVNRRGNTDGVWSSSQKRNLTYCVSNNFGSGKAAIVQAMQAAANGWQQAADVRFIYKSSEDGNCTRFNDNVVFDVNPTQGAPYLARAFFPGQSRRSRNVIVDKSVWEATRSASSILAHELGHVLGFRHEHTRPEAGACFEDNSWRPLTPYDSSSIMHYPQCNGASNTLAFSQQDFDGIASIYGSPSGGGGGTPDTRGTARTDSALGSLKKGQTINYQSISITPGSPLEIRMRGTGDADLYVRYNQKAELYAYHCRPYLKGSNETCSLDVPKGATEAHIMINGYTNTNYKIDVSWVEP